MKSGRKPTMPPQPDALDRILAGEEPLLPSSGFVAVVMEQVRAEAAAPPPLPFPWQRALPGIALAAGVLGWGGFELVRSAWVDWNRLALPMPRLPANGHPLDPALWTAIALAAALFSWLYALRLAGRGSLL